MRTLSLPLYAPKSKYKTNITNIKANNARNTLNINMLPDQVSNTRHPDE